METVVAVKTSNPVIISEVYLLCGYHDDFGNTVIDEYSTLEEAMAGSKTSWLPLYYSSIWIDVKQEIKSRISL